MSHNNNCKQICIKYRSASQGIRGIYSKSRSYCKFCNVILDFNDEIRCPCCNHTLRTHARKKYVGSLKLHSAKSTVNNI